MSRFEKFNNDEHSIWCATKSERLDTIYTVEQIYRAREVVDLFNKQMRIMGLPYREDISIDNLLEYNDNEPQVFFTLYEWKSVFSI